MATEQPLLFKDFKLPKKRKKHEPPTVPFFECMVEGSDKWIPVFKT